MIQGRRAEARPTGILRPDDSVRPFGLRRVPVHRSIIAAAGAIACGPLFVYTNNSRAHRVRCRQERAQYRLDAASRQQINDLRRLKEQLTAELAGWIATHGLRQTDAAAILMVTRPRVSDVVNRKTAKFTIDALVEMLGRAGKCVSVAVR